VSTKCACAHIFAALHGEYRVTLLRCRRPKCNHWWCTTTINLFMVTTYVVSCYLSAFNDGADENIQGVRCYRLPWESQLGGANHQATVAFIMMKHSW